ncbi:hypothetical protein PUNSTDRAFT_77726, partial [Punctularia strigosozonata HHB-11173 SS5]
GIHVTLYIQCATSLIRESKRGPASSRRSKIYWLIYISLLFGGATINLATGIKWNEMLWIDHRDFVPGGPNGYLEIHFSHPINTLSSAAFVFDNILADALLVFRCLIIWDYYRYLNIIPVLLFLASTILGILTMFQSAQPTASLWTHSTVNVAIPYWSTTISLTLVVTILTCIRLFSARRTLINALGAEHARLYTSVMTVVIESAALYSVVGLIFIICYARNSNVQNLVLPIMGQAMCIAPLFITFRAARGRALTRGTLRTGALSTMKFGERGSNTEAGYTGESVPAQNVNRLSEIRFGSSTLRQTETDLNPSSLELKGAGPKDSASAKSESGLVFA